MGYSGYHRGYSGPFDGLLWLTSGVTLSSRGFTLKWTNCWATLGSLLDYTQWFDGITQTSAFLEAFKPKARTNVYVIHIWSPGQKFFIKNPCAHNQDGVQIFFFFFTFKGVLHLLLQKAPNLACFMLYLKIINIFLKNNIYIL